MIGLVRFRSADSSDILHLTTFLAANSLPTVGLEDWYMNFLVALDDKGAWVGVVGYEVYNQSALLRSVAVEKALRGQGHGRALVERALEEVRKRSIHTVYLLTDTAETYFERLGFEPVGRDQIEPTVRNSKEFTDCCLTAHAMRIRL